MSINLWRTMGRIVNMDETGEAEALEPLGVQGVATMPLRMIGPIKAMESLIPLLRKLFGTVLQGQSLGQELVSLARYATQEDRARVSLDFPPS